jgi:two-component system, chemotaxis family, CheB/CheR fusion protein
VLGERAEEVVHWRLPSGELNHLILFEEAERARAAGKPASRLRGSGRAREERQRTVKRLEDELASTKEYLQTIIEQHEATNEELKPANEEILSSNEELQSTYEELETAKESCSPPTKSSRP